MSLAVAHRHSTSHIKEVGRWEHSYEDNEVLRRRLPKELVFIRQVYSNDDPSNPTREWKHTTDVKQIAMAEDVIKGHDIQDILDEVKDIENIPDFMRIEYNPNYQVNSVTNEVRIYNNIDVKQSFMDTELSVEKIIELTRKHKKLRGPFRYHYWSHSEWFEEHFGKDYDQETDENRSFHSQARYFIITDDVLYDKNSREFVCDPNLVKRARGYVKAFKTKRKREDHNVLDELSAVLQVIDKGIWVTKEMELALSSNSSTYSSDISEHILRNAANTIDYLKSVRRYNKIKGKLRTALKALFKLEKQFLLNMNIKFFGKKNDYWIALKHYREYRITLFRWLRICRELGIDYPEQGVAKFLKKARAKAYN